VRTEQSLDRRRGSVVGVAVAMAALLLAAALPAGLAGPAVADTGSPSPSPSSTGSTSAAGGDSGSGPINYAVLVDESGSITPTEMAAEQDAASQIAVGDVNPGSRVSIIGFADAETDTQSAVDVECQLTRLDLAGRDQIGGCAGKLKSRTANQGQGTDFPSAISQGIDQLTRNTDPAVPRVLFVLTDGVLDVKDSVQYRGLPDPQAAGRAALVSQLKAAADARIQIWPLGFGPNTDRAVLDQMASSGYQQGCVSLPDATPRAALVTGAAGLGDALRTAFAAAHCVRKGDSGQGYPPLDITVRISDLATVGSIVVDKGDTAVTATYFDPNGHQVPSSGTFDGSGFELAGSGQRVEALRIVDPLPGPWRVHLDAPGGHRGNLATVSVLWQGELRGLATMDPPSPQAGERVTATLRLVTRDSTAIGNAHDYQGLSVGAELVGDGFDAVPITLADNGNAPDDKAGDGVFRGYVTVPASATGALRVTGKLTSIGLTAAVVSYPGRVAPAVTLVSAALTVHAGVVHPGDRIAGTLAVHNDDRTAHTLALSVQNVDGARLRFDPPQLVLQPGASGTREVTLVVGPSAAFGARLGGPLELVGAATVIDTSDHDRVLTPQSQLSLSVVPKPGFWAQWWALIVALIAVLGLLVAALVSQRRIKQIRRNAAGLPLNLLSEDGQVVNQHTARSGPKGWYEFAVVEPTGTHPRIERRPGGIYAVQRSPDGGALLRTRNSGQARLLPGGSVPLEFGLSLALGEGGKRPRQRPGRRTRPKPGIEPQSIHTDL
jgi:hypothetical protein